MNARTFMAFEGVARAYPWLNTFEQHGFVIKQAKEWARGNHYIEAEKTKFSIGHREIQEGIKFEDLEKETQKWLSERNSRFSPGRTTKKFQGKKIFSEKPPRKREFQEKNSNIQSSDVSNWLNKQQKTAKVEQISSGIHTFTESKFSFLKSRIHRESRFFSARGQPVGKFANPCQAVKVAHSFIIVNIACIRKGTQRPPFLPGF